MANDSYLGVTAHALDSSWKLHSFVLEVHHVAERHYTAACADDFGAVSKHWGIYDKVTTFATDNARNVTVAVSLLPFEHMPCTAHTLQLSVNKAINEAGVEALLSKCRKIVGHFKHSPANTTELKKQQEILKMNSEMLIQDVSTRWNSTLMMIQRLTRNKEPVTAVLLDEHHKHNLAILSEATGSSNAARPLLICNRTFGWRAIRVMLSGSAHTVSSAPGYDSNQ